MNAKPGADTVLIDPMSELLNAIEEHDLSALNEVDALSIQDLFGYLERCNERPII